MKFYTQRPSVESNWLTDNAEENRQFWKAAGMPEGQALPECTNEEKEAWECEHPEPEPAKVVE